MANLNMSPDSVASIWNKKGLSLRKQGKLAESIECYERALEADPACGPAWSNKARALDELSKLDQALKCYSHALKLSPNSSSTWNNMGYAYRKLKRFKEAIDCYERAIKLKPAYDKPWFNKGYILEQQARYKEALECFNRALELRPDNEKYRRSREIVLDTMRNLNKSRLSPPLSSSGGIMVLEQQEGSRFPTANSSGASTPTSDRSRRNSIDEYDQTEGYGANLHYLQNDSDDDDGTGLSSEPPPFHQHSAHRLVVPPVATSFLPASEPAAVLASPRESYFSASTGLSQSTGIPPMPSLENRGGAFASATNYGTPDTNAVISTNGSSAFAGVPRTNATPNHSQIGGEPADVFVRPRRLSKESQSSNAILARTVSPTPQQQIQSPHIQQLQLSQAKRSVSGDLLPSRTRVAHSLDGGTEIPSSIEHPQPIRMSLDSMSVRVVHAPPVLHHSSADGQIESDDTTCEIALDQGGPLEAVQKHLQTLNRVEDVNLLEAKIEQLLIAVRLKKNLLLKQEQDQESGKCVVCLENMKTHICVPCAHLCLCESCAEQIVKRRRCPLCNQGCTNIYKVYK